MNELNNTIDDRISVIIEDCTERGQLNKTWFIPEMVALITEQVRLGSSRDGLAAARAEGGRIKAQLALEKATDPSVRTTDPARASSGSEKIESVYDQPHETKVQ